MTCMWFVLAFACMGWVLNQLICSACVVVLGRLADCGMLLVPWFARLLLDSTPHTSLLYACRSIPFAIPFAIPLYLAMTALYMFPASINTSIEPKAVRACPYTGHVGTICMEQSARLTELEIN